MTTILNPCELEIDLFCKGLRIHPETTLVNDARILARTRAGLGSGLELVIPGELKDIWLNVPVEEDFTYDSPYELVKSNSDYLIMDERLGHRYPVQIPPQPDWYSLKTSRGVPMAKIGVLQGTYLGIYLFNSCSFWYHSPSLGCKFCTTGMNVGVNEVAYKDIEDVVEVARAAKEESGVTFVHLNSGYMGRDQGLDLAAPYVKALKERVGVLTGVQVIPSPNFWKYDWLIDCGADHFSFCYEFHNPDYFSRLCPGKEKLVGQRTFFNALEYSAQKMGRGKVSGEIIAGPEPIQDTLKAIDYITGVGAFPTVCIFRPTIGSDMERHPLPIYEDMRLVMEYMWDACRRNGIPIGAAPNIEVSLIVNPDDARYLPKRDFKWQIYESKLAAVRQIFKPIFARQLKPRPVKGNPKEYPSDAPLPVMPLTKQADLLAQSFGFPTARADHEV